MILLLDIKGMEAAVEVASLAGHPEAKVWMQQSVNRSGNWAKGMLAKTIQRALPVKLKYIRSRLRWRNMDRTGLPGRLRIYGGGKGQSAWIRPRHMGLKAENKYAVHNQITGATFGPLTRQQHKRYTKRVSIRYGVGGSFAESQPQTVAQGFVASVHAGRKFHMLAGYAGFDRKKALVFERVGQPRLPIVHHRGVTVGMAAYRLQLAPVVERRLADRALKEFRERMERELAAKLAKGIR